MAAQTTKLTNLNVTGNLTVGGTATGAFGVANAPQKIASGSFTAGQLATSNGGACGTGTFTATGALVGDTVVCNLSGINYVNGSGPVHVRYLFGEVVSANTVQLWGWDSVSGSPAYDSTQAGTWMVLR